MHDLARHIYKLSYRVGIRYNSRALKPNKYACEFHSFASREFFSVFLLFRKLIQMGLQGFCVLFDLKVKTQ